MTTVGAFDGSIYMVEGTIQDRVPQKNTLIQSPYQQFFFCKKENESKMHALVKEYIREFNKKSAPLTISISKIELWDSQCVCVDECKNVDIGSRERFVDCLLYMHRYITEHERTDFSDGDLVAISDLYKILTNNNK
ncbi:MAG: hypothetical protein WC375_12635 [Methanomassiliicoccales archaeon]|jgi:hypothetical protein